MSGEEAGRRRGLGRGLASLLGDDADDLAELDRLRQSRTVPIEFLHPGPFQPRRRFGEEELASLVESVREKGVLQPILVRRDPDNANQYQIIAGERRWRAAQEAQLHEVPVLVKDLDDRDALEVALVENIQRQDLNALEEAEGYRRLTDEYGHTQEEVGKAVGKSRSHVANTLRLLALPEPVKDLLEDGALTAGHARALLNADDPARLAAEVAKRGLNVRDTERLVQKRRAAAEGIGAGDGARQRGPGRKAAATAKDADTLALENELAAALGLRVALDFDGASGGGTVTVYYTTLEQLDDVIARLHRNAPPRPARDERMAPADEEGEENAAFDALDLDDDDPLVPKG